MHFSLLFAGVAVSDLAASKAWYELLFGRPPDVVVTRDEVMWRIAEGAWLYVIADPDRSGRSLVTMSVGHLDVTLAELADRGIKVASIETIPGSGRKTTVFDPDGNSVSIIEIDSQV